MIELVGRDRHNVQHCRNLSKTSRVTLYSWLDSPRPEASSEHSDIFGQGGRCILEGPTAILAFYLGTRAALCLRSVASL